MDIPAAMSGARLLSAGRVAPDPKWRMKPHSHPFHELIVVVDGKMWVEQGGVSISAVEGDLLLYPAGSVHAERSDRARPLESLFIAFECAGFDGRKLGRISDERGRVRQMARWIYEDGHASSPASLYVRQAVMLAVLAEILRTDGSEDRPLVASVRRYIAEHLEEKLTLGRLGNAAGLSKYHFLRAYRKATGRTPMQDVRAIRANYARELILGTNLPLKDIAPRAGLGNEYSMSRLFRRLFGTPPGRYRTGYRTTTYPS